jgi:hypothetical protein
MLHTFSGAKEVCGDEFTQSDYADAIASVINWQFNLTLTSYLHITHAGRMYISGKATFVEHNEYDSVVDRIQTES